MLARPVRLPASNESAAAAAAAVVSILSGADPDRLPASGINPDPSLLPHLRQSLTAIPESAFPALARWTGSATAVSLLASRGLFAASWRLLLSPSSPPPPLDAFAPLIRRYARLGRATAALRAFHFLRRHPDRYTVVDAGDCSHAPTSLLNMAVGALCKEGHPRAAAKLIQRCWHEEETLPAPDERTYNMLLDGWSSARRLDKVEKLWAEMRLAGMRPTVVSYGTLIKALCMMQHPDKAAGLLDEMREQEIEVNLFTCNPIVYSLALAGRFQDAYKLLEKFSLYGVAPNISTFNSLVLGYCKYGDLAGASSVLKAMVGRGILPTAKTYNYFFVFFAKTCNIEMGMNLYSKMVNNGYAPDQITYNLLIKMLCEANRLELVVQMIKEMKTNGFESDLATSTMLIHLLCRSHRFEEACVEFEDMFRRGLVPQYITYRMLMKELKRLGLVELVEKLTNLMRSVPHSTKLPGSYREKEGDDAREKRRLILDKAQAVSNVLKGSIASKLILRPSPPSSLKSCALVAVFALRNARLMPSRSLTSRKIWTKILLIAMGQIPSNCTGCQFQDLAKFWALSEPMELESQQHLRCYKARSSLIWEDSKIHLIGRKSLQTFGGLNYIITLHVCWRTTSRQL